MLIMNKSYYHRENIKNKHYKSNNQEKKQQKTKKQKQKQKQNTNKPTNKQTKHQLHIRKILTKKKKVMTKLKIELIQDIPLKVDDHNSH